jgi:glycosyltransferase involved in cell wall biosynthesis
MLNERVSVIVPAYNEEENIAETLDRLSRVQEELPGLEIIVVDDGSRDGTVAKVGLYSNVKCIRHSRNMGKGAALSTGIRAAIGGIVVVQDADLEYFPELIPELVKPILKDEVDVVYGTRMLNGVPRGMSLSHFLGNRLLSLAASLVFDCEITDIMTGYKAFRKATLKGFEIESRGFSIEIELTVKSLENGWKFMEMPLDYIYRRKGESKIRYRDGLLCFLQLLSGESTVYSHGENFPSKSTTPNTGIQLVRVMINTLQLVWRGMMNLGNLNSHDGFRE